MKETFRQGSKEGGSDLFLPGAPGPGSPSSLLWAQQDIIKTPHTQP